MIARVLLACGIACAAAATARAELRPRYGGTVEAALLGAPATLDPVLAHSAAELTVAGLVFDTLYTIAADGTVQPHLAVGAPVFDAARGTVVVALRRGVVFHDGTPVTPADVADSLERVHQRLGWLLAPVATIRAVPDGVELGLRVPGSDPRQRGIDVAALLALPQAAITRRGQPPGPRAIGSGPFAIDSFEPANRRLVLRAFDEHFAGRPYLDRLVLGWFDTPDAEARRFETGAAQLSARGVSAFAGARPKYPASEVESPAAVLLFIGFGRQHAAVTGNRGFRRALDLALDRGALATITSGEHTQPTRLPLPVEAGAPLLPPAGRAGDATAARAAIAELGKRIPALAPGALSALRLTILVDASRPDDRELALRVARGLDRLGIGFAIEVVPAERLRERVQRGECDLWIGQLVAPITVPVAWWGAAFAAGGDDWAERRLAAGPIDAGAAAAAFSTQLPILPLMFRSILIWHRTDVHGLGFDAAARPGLADLFWVKARP